MPEENGNHARDDNKNDKAVTPPQLQQDAGKPKEEETVDEFGLPTRKPKRMEPAEEQRVSSEDGSDGEDFVDAPTGSEDATRKLKEEKTAKQPEVTREEPSGHASPSPQASVVVEARPEVQSQEDHPSTPKPTESDEGQVQLPSKTSSPEAKPGRQSARYSVPVGSEWSHMQLAPKIEKEEQKEEDQWQTMPAYAPYDIYDDDNKLIAKEAVGYEDDMMQYGTLGGAGKGYTRVQLDEDAQSATSMDENTAYLFKEGIKGTNVIDEDEEARDALSQMQATKELLTEGQRIAYVGTVRLSAIEMLKDIEKFERVRSARKAIDFASASCLMWGQKVMLRLYAHMEIGSDEQLMIEQLAEHGVQAQDLTPALMINARVKNPVQKESATTPPTASTPTAATPRDSISTPNLSVTSPTDSSARSPLYDEHFSPTRSTASFHSRKSTDSLPSYENHNSEQGLDVKSPSELGDVKTLDIDIRWTVLCDLFLLLVSDSQYDSRSRQLLERVGAHLEISWLDICRFEKRVTDALEMQEAAEKENWNEDDHMEDRRKQALRRRLVVMGLATVGGGLVIGLSAGLLAPVIGAGLAAGFTTIGVGGTGAFLGGVGGTAIVATTGVVTGGTIGVRAADRRTGAVKTFEYRPLHNNKRVNLVVTISGWMSGKVDDVRLPFSTVDPIMGDIYSIHWEPEMLQSMGQTISILATEALTQTLQQVLGSTMLIALMAAIQIPVLLTKLAYLIDNPWNVSLARADLAGLILADSIIDRNLGCRPITLVGFSLGARVIYSCLRELAKKGQPGLVQNVYLFGAPVIANKSEFIKCRTVVSGRFLNGYATNDWILAYLFRITGGGIAKVAGLTALDEVHGIENINVTEWVPGHMSYRAAMPRLLREVGWEVTSDEFTEIEDPDPDNHQNRQRELINEIEEARKNLEEKPEKKSKFAFWRKKKAEKKEWETYDDRLKGGPAQEDLSQGDLEKKAEGVLFDIDAIRAEVKQLAGQDIEVKQLESTLPPMKITIEKPSSTDVSPLRSTRSYNDSIGPSSTQNGDRSYPSTADRSLFDDERHTDPRTNGNENITMSFDIPSSVAKNTEVPVDQHPDTRPPLKSHATAPMPTPVNMQPEHNAWADDDDFGQEGEIKMTFA